MKTGWLASLFGLREPKSLALSVHGGAQKCPDDILAEHTQRKDFHPRI